MTVPKVDWRKYLSPQEVRAIYKESKRVVDEGLCNVAGGPSCFFLPKHLADGPLKGKGAHVRCGIFKGDGPMQLDGHCWLKLRGGVLVDPTIGQYKTYGFIKQWPGGLRGIAVVPKGHPFAERYLGGGRPVVSFMRK